MAKYTKKELEAHLSIIKDDALKVVRPLRAMGIRVRFERIDGIRMFRVIITAPDEICWQQAGNHVRTIINREMGRYSIHFM